MERKFSAGFLFLVGFNSVALAQAATHLTQGIAPQFGEAYTVNHETLWGISQQLVKNSEFSIQQGVDAIKAKNPQAFHKGNLKQSTELTLPSREEMLLMARASKQFATAEPEPLPGTGASAEVAPAVQADPKTQTATNAQGAENQTNDNTPTPATTEAATEATTEATTEAPQEAATPTEETPAITSEDAVLPLPVYRHPPSHTYNDLMDSVIAQNGGYSNEPLFECKDDDKFCFSGLLDLDGRYYDHKANAGFGSQGPLATSSWGGVGVRPTFGPAKRTVTGSINNANAFIDLRLSPYAKIHTDLAYVNGSVLLNSYSWEYGADWGSVYRVPAALKVDELYLVFANSDLLPLYFKVGRMYSDFGDYIPNAYGINTLTPSLTQLMTQSRTGAGQVGVVLQNGLYGSFTVSYAQESFATDNYPADLIVRSTIGPNKRNFSGKLGFRNTLWQEINTNLNVSFIADLRDVDYINDSIWFINSFVNIDTPFLYSHVANKQGGLAYHAEFYRCPFGITFEGMYSSGKLNPGIDGPFSGTWDSHVRTGGVEARVDFKTLDHPSNFRVAYQWARHTQVIGGNFTGSPTFHNMLPRHRWQGTYSVHLVDHFNLGLQWVQDHDFDEPRNGIDITSNMAIVRLDAQF